MITLTAYEEEQERNGKRSIFKGNLEVVRNASAVREYIKLDDLLLCRLDNALQNKYNVR